MMRSSFLSGFGSRIGVHVDDIGLLRCYSNSKVCGKNCEKFTGILVDRKNIFTGKLFNTLEKNVC